MHTCSSVSPPLIRIPSSAPLPVPTMMAVGVASPSAQGQAMIMTEMNIMSAKTNDEVGRSVMDSPQNHHTKKDRVAIPITAGTKIPATLSASRWTGAFEPCASSTIRMICESMESFPSRVARILKNPVLLTEPPTTAEPGFLSTGRLSPVIMDSSMEVVPSRIVPSTGIFSPDRTRTVSPSPTSLMGMSTSVPLRSTRAVFGWSPMSLRMASEARLFARASSSRPINTNAMIITAASK